MRDSRANAVAVAGQLQSALETHGLTADVNDGYGLAVVSVWRGLLVWTNGAVFWWCTGWNDQRDRPVYAWHSTAEPARAARRIAARCAELRAVDQERSQPGPTTHGRVLFRTDDPL